MGDLRCRRTLERPIVETDPGNSYCRKLHTSREPLDDRLQPLIDGLCVITKSAGDCVEAMQLLDTFLKSMRKLLGGGALFMRRRCHFTELATRTACSQ